MRKSLYGLNQASRQWNNKLTDALITNEYNQSEYDHSSFTKEREGKMVIMLLYMDDISLTGSNADLLGELKKVSSGKFKIKDLEKLRYFLWIEIAHSSEVIVMNQHKYAMEWVSDSGLSAANPALTPL